MKFLTMITSFVVFFSTPLFSAPDKPIELVDQAMSESDFSNAAEFFESYVLEAETFMLTAILKQGEEFIDFDYWTEEPTRIDEAVLEFIDRIGDDDFYFDDEKVGLKELATRLVHEAKPTLNQKGLEAFADNSISDRRVKTVAQISERRAVSIDGAVKKGTKK